MRVLVEGCKADGQGRTLTMWAQKKQTAIFGRNGFWGGRSCLPHNNFRKAPTARILKYCLRSSSGLAQSFSAALPARSSQE